MNIGIFGKENCTECEKVKHWLNEHTSIQYDYLEVGKDIGVEELESIVNRLVKTVPVIVVDGHEVSFKLLKMIVIGYQYGLMS